MINVGNAVKVHMDGPGGFMVQVFKGLVHTIGNGMVEVRSDKEQRRFSLRSVALEKYSPDANEYNTANVPGMAQIKNKATGNGFTKKGSKVRFKRENEWEHRPERVEV